MKRLSPKMLKVKTLASFKYSESYLRRNKNSGFLTLDVNKVTVDDVIGVVDGLAAVPATVVAGENWDFVGRVVGHRADGAHRILLVRAVPLKGDWRRALNAADKVELNSFRDFCHVWDDSQYWLGQRHCGEDRGQRLLEVSGDFL